MQMLSKDKLKYPTEITDEQLRYLITAFENKMTEFYPVGREAEIARQLLSLREQLAELKALEPAAWMDEKGNVCTIDNRLRGLTAECADAYRKYNIPLFTASKPAED
ncbi:TPA: hypothetical protein ACGPMR_002904 [Yersinia enterocolitica]|uniref:hypothetical protein n=1 Tax=Yersinia enterocolitica TaxID=630 RepID=UPI003708ECDA